MKKRSYDRFVKKLGDNGLFVGMSTLSQLSNVSLRDLYEGLASPQVVDARQTVYRWLFNEKNLGHREIARLFDRAPNGVWKLVSFDRET